MWIQRFVKGEFAEVGCFVDGIGLADRIEDDAALFGDVVDRELHGGGKAADEEVHLFLFDQLQGPRRPFPGIELAVAHDQFRLAPPKPTRAVKWGARQWSTAHRTLACGP